VRVLGILALLAVAAPLTACGNDDASGSANGTGEGTTTITVLAAASLTGTFTELADRFEADHPGTRVRLAFDSSATLAQQAVGGAPADVLATADTDTMESARAALATRPQDFATNTMVLVTPKDDPAGISTFADLEKGDADIVACVETAPCGKVAAALFADNSLTTKPASLEVDVEAVLAKVTSDEADAGFVYGTDAVAAGDRVRQVAIPHADEELTTYPVAALEQSRNAHLAAEFVDLVTSGAGRRVLTNAGFGQP
jgi:molybdate transport system substrate-binding protein